MAPLAQAVLVACIVVLTVVLVSTLLALRKTALRAESVLGVVERDLLPMVARLESLANELRELTHHASEELEHVSVIVRRVDDLSGKTVRLVVALGGFTRAGQIIGLAAGVKRGLDVFLRRMRDKR